MQVPRFVRKRDGRIVPFDKSRITNAIFKAAQAVGGRDRRTAERLADEVTRILAERFGPDGIPSVEEIQDIVEKVLIENGHAKTAKAYILYREQRAQARELKFLMEDAIGLVDDYLERSDWRVSENSNMSFSLQGLNHYLSSSVVARYWLRRIYPPEVRRAHEEGDIHIHDLGILGVYCCGWDLLDLLMSGFGGVEGKVESKPPRHFRTALGQIVNFFYTLQGEAAGAQAFSNLDTLLAPLVRYDRLSYKEVKQAIQEFVFNLNVPTRVGFQTPFTNCTLDIMPPPTLKDMPVVVGGEVKEETYGEFEEEMRMINRAFAEVMLEGDAKGRIFTFPIPTYNIGPDFPWDDPDLEPVWELAAKFGAPYFGNFINSEMRPEDVRSMCCRLRLDTRELRRRGGGLFAADPLTGSVGVVTINMPRIGYLARDEDEFFERLDALLTIARTSLEVKRKVLERLTEEGLYPYARRYLRGVKGRTGSYWSNHFSTIGLVGMHEACLNLLGVGIEHPRGREFAVRVLKFMRERALEFQRETGNLYNLEATPAEGASYRLARIDREKFGDIVTSGRDVPFYTNSTQLPVDFEGDLFDVLRHQEELQCLYTGGTVVHIYLGEPLYEPEAAKAVVRKVFENFRVPYITLTPVFSVCPNHGFLGGRHDNCPICGQRCEVYSRIVGYFRPVQNWNEGKREEFGLRRPLVA